MSGKTKDPIDTEFEEQVAPRRLKAGVTGDPRGTWGLALSGGGIRSATFCLGLIRGLARNQILKQFDFLSTVSGGGYVGSSLGRLYGNKHTAREVEDGIASDHSMWLWWLRNNGRYLTPSGAKDLGFAGASIVRGIVATHLEIGVLLLLLAAVVLLPHTLVALRPPQADLSFWSLEFIGLSNSIWWWLLPAPIFAFSHQLISYWYTKDQRTIASLIAITAATVVGAYLAFQLIRIGLAEFKEGLDALENFSPVKTILAFCSALVLLATVTAWVATAYDLRRGTPIAEIRLSRTKKLSYSLWAMLLITGIAFLDAISWAIAKFFWEWNPESFPIGKAALAGVALAAGRFVLPEIQKRMAISKKPSINTENALNVLGTLLSLLVLVFWTTLLHLSLFVTWAKAKTPESIQHALGSTPLDTWYVVAGFSALYVILSCRSFELLNLASLHNFYRARIERAYVSSGNSKDRNCAATDSKPIARFPHPAFLSASPADTMCVAPLTEAIEGDDIDLTLYEPQAHGGPIHLINCCVNQSVDDRTGLYNADRKGISLTVSSLGVEVGTSFAKGSSYAVPPGKLSRWIAISGAAASTGMGSRTTPGFAALLFMSGIRLGYWTKSLIPEQTTLRHGLSWLSNAAGKLAPKPLAIVAESMARFPGIFGSVWYVSDGGHFDNTGVYALLKRNCRLIVAADCGADPKYLFADLESLVRKAKIDYAATIEFVDPARVSDRVSPELRGLLGTPETVTPEAGSRWLVLGRIKYANGTEGTLVVVKPRRLDKMPFDIVAYADRNPDFPQQTTGDQFFDEAQWEAYHQLGYLIGNRLNRSVLKNALTAVDEMTNAPSSLATAEANNSPVSSEQNRRNRVGLTVRASLGAGLSLSLILALWQGFEKYREARRIEDKEYNEAFIDLTERITDPEKLRRLTSDHFNDFAKQSKARGDNQFEKLRDLVKIQCAGKTPMAPLDSSACYTLHSEMRFVPPIKYDYWLSQPKSVTSTGEDKNPAVEASRLPDASTLGARAAAEGISVQIIYQAGSDPDKPQKATVVRDAAGQASGEPPSGAAETMPPLPPLPLAATKPFAQAARPMPTGDKLRAACKLDGNRGVRVYIHIYDEARRPEGKKIASDISRRLGIAMPPIENVVATANSSGRDSPFVWSTPALVYHGGVPAACPSAIGSVIADKNLVIRKLPSAFKSNPGMIELWLPPSL